MSIITKSILHTSSSQVISLVTKHILHTSSSQVITCCAAACFSCACFRFSRHSFFLVFGAQPKVMPAMSPVYTNPYNVVCPVCSCRTTTILWTFVSHDCFVAMFYHCSECCWRLYHVDFESHRLLNPHIPLPTLDSSEQRDSAWTE